jgi:uncharacterized protein
MRIELDKLESNSSNFAHVYEPEELTLDEEHARLIEPPEVQGRLNRRSHEVQLRGTVRARAEVDCARCLQSVEMPIETSFDVKYISSDDYRATETVELQEEDLSVAVFEDATIDIDELVREQVLLALPTRALCSEECKGLCPVCGANKNRQSCACESALIDPRWGALKNLVNGE